MSIRRRVSFVVALAGVDLAKQYPATLDWSEGAPARTWKCEAKDVWGLTRWNTRLVVGGKTLQIEMGPANVAFGHHDRNVVWAVVIPAKPGKLTSAPAGEGEEVASAWLRFHPSIVNTLFPADTVTRNGPESVIPWALRVATHKINGSWQAGNLPVIPWKHSIVVDLETKSGTRRFFSLDMKEQKLEYEPFFEKKALPWLAPIAKDDALAAFQEVVDAFDKEYAKFGLHPEYDFAKSAAALKKKVGGAKTCYEVGLALAELLRPLDDLHVDVTVDGEWIPCATRDRPENGSWDGVRSQLRDLVDTKQDCFYGRTKDDVGYLCVYQLGDKELPKRVDEALEALADTWAMIVDLRFNGGGDELLAREIAGRFLDQERVYSVNRYRNGPKHDQCGPWLERKCAPRGPWRYESPVIVLQGQRTMSSAESLALMFAQCPQVTTMGDRTAGSSGNPRMVETRGKIKVRLPRWDDRDPQQNVIEGKGIPPEVQVDAKPEELTKTSDPVFKKALATLRDVPDDERQAGRREGAGD